MRPVTTVVRYDARCASAGSVAGASALGQIFWILISLGMLLSAAFGLAAGLHLLLGRLAHVLGVLG